MKNKLLHIYERFPGEIQVINRLISEDSDFLVLCEDYDACVHALRHWAGSHEPEAKNRFDEYRTLVLDLEEEIKQVVSDNV